MVEVKIINKSPHPLPSYSTTNAAGMDICAFLQAPLTIKPLERHLVPTGLFIELPDGYEAQIRPRSGLTIKHGITILNSPGTVDSDYRGEIKVILVNLSNQEYTINDGERICQMVVAQHETVVWKNVDVLLQSGRGEGGFGHTGK